MKKSELVSIIAQETSLTQKDVTKVLDSTIENIIKLLGNGDSISFLGFGTFSTIERSARQARVPGTDKVIDVPATKAVKFKVGKNLKEVVSSK